MGVKLVSSNKGTDRVLRTMSGPTRVRNKGWIIIWGCL